MVTPEETPEQREERLQRILRQVEERLRSLLPNPYPPLEKTEAALGEDGSGSLSDWGAVAGDH